MVKRAINFKKVKETDYSLPIDLLWNVPILTIPCLSYKWVLKGISGIRMISASVYRCAKGFWLSRDFNKHQTTQIYLQGFSIHLFKNATHKILGQYLSFKH